MEIVNRVAESEITVFNLEELWDGSPVVQLDLAEFLHGGEILREKVFRDGVKDHEWEQYDGRHVAVHCSADAIIPTWAYMLVAAKLRGRARSTSLGSEADLVRDHYVRALEQVDWTEYEGKPVVVKGCGSAIVPAIAYLLATQKLQEVASKLMFGEPCSAVPIWRRPRVDRAARSAKAVKPGIPRST